MGTMATQPRQSIPVGYRFQPTQKEVVDHYLQLRNFGHEFSTNVPDINDTTRDPWTLADIFKDELNHQGNDGDWWFFSSRTRNQKTVRRTKSGKWKDTNKGKKIPETQIMGIMTPFVFHRQQTQGDGRVEYIRDPKWKLYEYRLTNDCLDGFPFIDEKTVYVLCHLKRDDKAKIKTHVQVPQTNGDEISSRTPRKKRAMEAPLLPVNQDSIFTSLGQQMHPQDCFLSPYQPQSIVTFENVPRPVESFGTDSSTLELSRGSNSNGSGSSGCVDFNRDILSNSLGDQNALFDQLLMEMLVGDVDAPEFHGVPPPFDLLSYQVLQDDPSWETISSDQHNANLFRNQRAQSAKSLSGVVPAEEKKISAENRNARPQISSPQSPPAARSSVIVTEPRGFKESNSPSSAGSLPIVEARVIKEPTAANSKWKKNSIVKIKDDEKLALETVEKLRLKTRSTTQNQNTWSRMGLAIVVVGFGICNLLAIALIFKICGFV